MVHSLSKPTVYYFAVGTYNVLYYAMQSYDVLHDVVLELVMFILTIHETTSFNAYLVMLNNDWISLLTIDLVTVMLYYIYIIINISASCPLRARYEWRGSGEGGRLNYYII